MRGTHAPPSPLGRTSQRLGVTAPQRYAAVQSPQQRMAPQPSPVMPHCAPWCAQVTGRHLEPQVVPRQFAGQVSGQGTGRPHASTVVPHATPFAVQDVAGVVQACVVASQTWPALQPPQRTTAPLSCSTPQPTPASTHAATEQGWSCGTGRVTQEPPMHTWAVEQSLAPQLVPSGAGVFPHPASRSQLATWHGATGWRHLGSASRCAQPSWPQTSRVQASWSSQVVSVPTHSPRSQRAALKQALVDVQSVPSGRGADRQVPASGLKATVVHAVAGAQSKGKTPSPVRRTGTSLMTRSAAKRPASEGWNPILATELAPAATLGCPSRTVNGSLVDHCSATVTGLGLTTSNSIAAGKPTQMRPKSTGAPTRRDSIATGPAGSDRQPWPQVATRSRTTLTRALKTSSAARLQSVTALQLLRAFDQPHLRELDGLGDAALHA